MIIIKHCGTVPLETERLRLRRYEKADAVHAYRNWTNDPEVTKYLRWNAHRSLSETEELGSFWLGKYKDKRWYHWIIALKDTDEPIGTISAARTDDLTGTVEIGYCIGTRFRNTGYTTEALREVIRFFFRQVGANRIEARHDLRNTASGRVMEKCGMTFEGTLRSAELTGQGLSDVCVYSILADEFNGQSSGANIFSTAPAAFLKTEREAQSSEVIS